jgi:hypothetical protein
MVAAAMMVAIVLLFAADLRLSEQEKQQKTQTNADQQAVQVSPEQELADYTQWLTVFTGILAVSTFGLWLATRDLVRDAKETSRKELRAYLKLTTTDPCEVMSGLDQTTVQLTLENAGKTPARRVIVQATMEMFEFPLKSHLPPERLDENSAVTVCHPSQRIVYDAVLHRGLTAVEQAQITTPNSSRRLYVYGRVDYIDVFDRPQWTTVRYISAVANGQTIFTSGGEGNDAS